MDDFSCVQTSRRLFIKHTMIAAAGIGLAGGVSGQTFGASMSISSSATGAWDCHTHIYGPWARFPLPANAAYTPEPAPFSELLGMHRRLGISHGVLVQAAPYGTDHSAILEAIASSNGHYRGVGIIDETTTDDQLQALHDGGLRGIRFNLMGHLPGPATHKSCARWPSASLRWGGTCWCTGSCRRCCHSSTLARPEDATGH